VASSPAMVPVEPPLPRNVVMAPVRRSMLRTFKCSRSVTYSSEPLATSPCTLPRPLEAACAPSSGCKSEPLPATRRTLHSDAGDGEGVTDGVGVPDDDAVLDGVAVRLGDAVGSSDSQLAAQRTARTCDDWDGAHAWCRLVTPAPYTPHTYPRA
jgi:hypothetical protein